MTSSRVLPILNLAGCVLITSIIVVQWLGERRLREEIRQLKQQVSTTEGSLVSETKKSEGLESDVSQLKESIESLAATRNQLESELAELSAANQLTTTNAEAAISTAGEQLEQWKKAVAERDEKIRELDSQLRATRMRLDEAINRLKSSTPR